MMAAMHEGLITDWLAYHVKWRGNALACVDLQTGRRSTYVDLFRRSARLAGGLKVKFDVGTGDRVMVLARNSTDVFEIMFACWRLGAVFLPANWRLTAPELEVVVRDCDPVLIIADDEFWGVVPNGPARQLSRPASGERSPYEELIKGSEPEVAFAPATLDTINTLLYTSGTTGEPKGVMCTWRMTMLAVIQAATSGRLSTETRTLTHVPLFHTAGLNGFATPLFHYGGAVHVMRNWDPEKCLGYLTDKKLGITHTLGVPTQFLMMSQHASFRDAVFPSVEWAGIGGAPTTLDLLRTWSAKGLQLCPSYGMTEVFGVARLPPERTKEKLGSVGWPVMYCNIRVLDSNGNPCPPGASGEIQLKGPGVTPGYWKKPDLTAAATSADGWFRTGDIGYQDEDGALFVIDRLKDMYISGGENVYPAEVENIISSFGEVKQVAVIGAPDPKWGEVGVAVVVLKSGKQLTTAEIRRRCGTKLAPYKLPTRVVFIDSLPLSAQGKVLKTELRKSYV